MASYKVNITGINTNELKVLSSKENNELFIQLQQGDLDAKDKLVNGNLKLVLSLIKRFNNGNYKLDDLFQVGVIGLIKANQNYQ